MFYFQRKQNQFQRRIDKVQVAAGRILNVLNADAKVTLVSPRDGLNDEVAYRVEKGQVDYIDRKFQPSDLDDVDMVLTAVDDPEASTQIWKLCKERKIAANIADVPPECDFYFGSVHRDGPLQIMVSTNGNGPKLASIVRKQIAANLPKNIGAAIQKVGMLRKKLRKVAPGVEEGPKRMQWYLLRQSQHFDIPCLIFFSIGCQECANLGALKILWRWRKRIWRYFWDFINRALCRALRRCVEGMSTLLMGASDGGEHRGVRKLV